MNNTINNLSIYRTSNQGGIYKQLGISQTSGTVHTCIVSATGSQWTPFCNVLEVLHHLCCV